MTVQSLTLFIILIYLAIGSLIGIHFVFKGIRTIDPIANDAPLRVRVLFFPGAIAIWPIVLYRTMILKAKDIQE